MDKLGGVTEELMEIWMEFGSRSRSQQAFTLVWSSLLAATHQLSINNQS